MSAMPSTMVSTEPRRAAVGCRCCYRRIPLANPTHGNIRRDELAAVQRLGNLARIDRPRMAGPNCTELLFNAGHSMVLEQDKSQPLWSRLRGSPAITARTAS